MKPVHHWYITKTQGSLLTDQTESPTNGNNSIKIPVRMDRIAQFSARYLIFNRANIIVYCCLAASVTYDDLILIICGTTVACNMLVTIVLSVMFIVVCDGMRRLMRSVTDLKEQGMTQ